MDKAILYDSTLCIACRACQVACKQWNGNSEDNTDNHGSYENPPGLSPETWIKIEFREEERKGKVAWYFNRRSCMHCTDAACVKVCPTGALRHHEIGFVIYNKELCSGCGYCVDFCPFHVPQIDRILITGLAKMDKCTFCTTPGLDRMASGLEPACVKSCPTDALKYGDRDELLIEAKGRVQTLKDDGYTNAFLYGEKELDGLHVMYVLEDSPEVYGLPINPQVPVAAIAWQDVIQPVGWAVGGLTLIGLGLNYIVARKAKMMREPPAAGKRE
jgi:formate dehydrogenase iron-sulfur subunit